MRDDEVQAEPSVDTMEHVRFAEALGLRVFWASGLREGALYLAKSRVVLLDAALPVGQVRRAINLALERIVP